MSADSIKKRVAKLNAEAKAMEAEERAVVNAASAKLEEDAAALDLQRAERAVARAKARRDHTSKVTGVKVPDAADSGSDPAGETTKPEKPKGSSNKGDDK